MPMPMSHACMACCDSIGMHNAPGVCKRRQLELSDALSARTCPLILMLWLVQAMSLLLPRTATSSWTLSSRSVENERLTLLCPFPRWTLQQPLAHDAADGLRALQEAMRLHPPNAFTFRSTVAPTKLGGELPLQRNRVCCECICKCKLAVLETIDACGKNCAHTDDCQLHLNLSTHRRF